MKVQWEIWLSVSERARSGFSILRVESGHRDLLIPKKINGLKELKA